MQCLSLDVVAPPAVVVGVRAKVQRAGNDVVPALRIPRRIATRFHNVNLARAGPRAVHIVSGQHPNSWPEPIASRQFGNDFHAAILDRGAGFGADAAGFDRIDNGAVGYIGSCNAISPGGTVTTVAAKINDVVLHHVLLLLESRLDDELIVLNEDILIRGSRHFELAITAGHSQLLGRVKAKNPQHTQSHRGRPPWPRCCHSK